MYHSIQSAVTTQPFQKHSKPFDAVHPKIKIDYDSKIIYFNSSAWPILKYWDCLATKKIPGYVFKGCPEVFDSDAKSYYDINIRYNNHLLRFFVVPFPEAGYIGLYGDFILKEKGN